MSEVGADKDKPDSFRITFPRQWVHLPADRKKLDLLYETVVENIDSAEQTVNASEKRVLEASFGQLRNSLQQSGLSSLAFFADIFPTDSSSQEDTEGSEKPDQSVVTAACAIRGITQKNLDTDLPLRPELLAAVFSLEKKPEDAVTSSHKLTALEPPEIVTLPAGKSLRLRNVLEYKQSLAEVVKVFTESYFIPHDEECSSLTLLQFSTPVLEMSKDFSSLFTSIANTFTLLGENDKTMPDVSIPANGPKEVAE